MGSTEDSSQEPRSSPNASAGSEPSGITTNGGSFAPGFSCTLRHSGLGTIWVEVGGHLDLTTAPSLDRALTQALSDALLVVLDLSQLVSVDSVGTDAIAAAEARAQRINRELLLAGELSEVAAA